MRVLVWNCQGVGSLLTILQLKECIKLHSPDIILLSETKNKKDVMDKVRKKLNDDKMVIVEPIGIAG